MPAETDLIVIRITASMMKFETQMAAMTRSAANSAAQLEKWLSSISICKASNGDFARMGQQASRS